MMDSQKVTNGCDTDCPVGFANSQVKSTADFDEQHKLRKQEGTSATTTTADPANQPVYQC